MFAPSVYESRRAALMGRVGSGLILLVGNRLIGMNYRANTYPFRQDGSFLYFTGLDEPDLLLLLDCDSGDARLHGPALGLEHAIWSGPSPSLEDLATRAGLTCGAGLDKARASCRGALVQGRTIHYLPTYQDGQILALARFFGHDPERVEREASQILIAAVVGLRGPKSADEVSEIRSAIAVSAEAYELLMRECRPGVSEMELFGHMQGLVLSRGCAEAFPTILTRQGEVLHNHSHDRELVAGDLLLVDSGVRSKMGYASDITRTLPVSGCMTARQRDIYDLVVAAQGAGVARMAPDVPFLECHLAAARVIAEGLRDLGLMRGNPDEAVAAGAHALFFPHGLGHMLGLDVHDMEGLGEDHVGYDQGFRRSQQFGLSGLRMARPLRPGFVMTVEPGIYFIPPLVARWREQRLHDAFIEYAAVETWLGFGGIRIEDDVLVTNTGSEVLSVGIPKESDEVCARMVACRC